MYIIYCLSSCQHVVDPFPWCADDTEYYQTDPGYEAIPEDPQPGEEEEAREWGADDLA